MWQVSPFSTSRAPHCCHQQQNHKTDRHRRWRHSSSMPWVMWVLRILTPRQRPPLIGGLPKYMCGCGCEYENENEYKYKCECECACECVSISMRVSIPFLDRGLTLLVFVGLLKDHNFRWCSAVVANKSHGPICCLVMYSVCCRLGQYCNHLIWGGIPWIHDWSASNSPLLTPNTPIVW